VNPKLIRRQFILLLVLAGIAYLWWQSLRPGRYAEWAEDLDLDAMSGFQWPDDDMNWSDKGGLVYTSEGDSLSIVVWSAASQGVHRHRIEHRLSDVPLRRIYLELDMEGTIGLLSLREADGSRVDILAQADSALVNTYDTSGTARWIPWPRDAISQEALLVHASRWPQTADERRATLIRYDPRTGVILQYPIAIKPTTDSTRTLWSGDRFVARVGYTPGNPHTQSICDANEMCWMLTDAYYAGPDSGTAP
jgi:hypothetical protein